MIYYLFLLFVHLVIIITLPKVKLRLKLPQFLKQQLLHADSSYYCGCSEGRAIQRETIGSSCSSFTNHVIPLLSLLHSAIILLTASPVYNWVCFNLILLLFFSFFFFIFILEFFLETKSQYQMNPESLFRYHLGIARGCLWSWNSSMIS